MVERIVFRDFKFQNSVGTNPETGASVGGLLAEFAGRGIIWLERVNCTEKYPNCPILKPGSRICHAVNNLDNSQGSELKVKVGCGRAAEAQSYIHLVPVVYNTLQKP